MENISGVIFKMSLKAPNTNPVSGKPAFMREGDPNVYDAASATIAWRRAVKYLHAQLG